MSRPIQNRPVIGIIGIILLIGIVKKNGIMLVDFAIVAERERHMPPIAAIREACLLRFRPIMMTTLAALFALFQAEAPDPVTPAAALGAAGAQAQTRIFRCGNTYTNDAVEAQAKGCKPLEIGRAHV